MRALLAFWFLVFVSCEQCLDDFEKMLQYRYINETTSYYMKNLFSAPGVIRGFSDYGDFDSCLAFEANETVYALVLAFGEGIYDYGSGYCLPASCSTNELVDLAFYTFPFAQDITYACLDIQTSQSSFPVRSFCVGLAVVVVLLAPLAYARLVAPMGAAPTARVAEFLRRTYSLSAIKASLTRQGAPGLRSLDGIRLFSTLWVIFFHTYFLPTYVIPLFRNYGRYEHDRDRWWFQGVAFGNVSVDAFFIASAVLALLKLTSLPRRRYCWKALLVRYVRYAAMAVLVYLVYTFVLPDLAMGPRWSFIYGSMHICYDNWWRTVFVFPTMKDCVGWFWYLSVEIQLFLVIVIPTFYLYRWRRAAAAAYGALFFAATTVCILVVSVHDQPYINATDEFFYYNSLFRTQPYVMGLWLVMLIKSRRGPSLERFFRQRRGAAVGVGAVLFVVSALVLAVHDARIAPDTWGVWGNALYNALFRPVFSLLCAYLVLAGYYAPENLVARFLSHRFWTPFTRLSFGAYAWHPILVYAYTAAARASPYYSFMRVLLEAFGFIALAFACSAVSYVLLERPVGALLGLFMRQKSLLAQAAPARGAAAAEDAQTLLPAAETSEALASSESA